jgi:hypothetical protein
MGRATQKGPRDFRAEGLLRIAPAHLKSLGRRSTLLHFSHSAIFLTLPFSKMVFIFISPPQGQ